MAGDTTYSINLDKRFGFLELIDLQKLIDDCKEPWFNQTLCQVNDCVVRIGIVHGEFHWHKHDNEDEFFYVVQGKFVIETEGKTVELLPKQSYAIPRGLMHCTRAPEPTVILMFEGAGVVPTGDQ